MEGIGRTVAALNQAAENVAMLTVLERFENARQVVAVAVNTFRVEFVELLGQEWVDAATWKRTDSSGSVV